MKRLLFLVVLAGCSPRSVGQRIDPGQVGRSLPTGFLFGTATAAHQIEGHTDNDWSDWEKGSFADGRPHVKNGDSAAIADDSWADHFAKDLDSMRALHVNAYRFSIEWSRIEPTEGVFDEDALERYRELLRHLRSAGITPMVTLFHFTLPRWVAADGGWTNPTTIDRFDAFVRHVVPSLAGLVDFWCPLNEPNVYSTETYLDAVFPPGLKDANDQMALAFLNQLKGQARASTSIRELDEIDIDADGFATRIGIAHHVRIFQPATSSTLDTAIAGLTDDFFNESVPRANATGRVRLFQPGSFDIDEEVPGLKGSLDWLGVNYYTRDTIRADLSSASFSNMYVPSGRPVNDLGWDLYPEGLYTMLMRFQAWGLPLYVTENGIADASGSKRADYLLQHVAALERASNDGADVRGYLHWSLADNFEWAEGYGARFGLYQIDFSSSARVRVPSEGVATFQTIAGNLGLVR